MSRRAWSLWFAALGVVLLAMFPAAGVAATRVTVAAANYEFRPPARTVHVGDTVFWTRSGDPHTVTSGTNGHPSGGPLDSGIRQPGGSYSFTFTKAGTYPYYCEVHVSLQMQGTITVLAAAATPRPTPSPTPRATPRATPRPTATQSPTPRSTPAPSPRPSSTPTPTGMPTPGPSVAVTARPTPSPASPPPAAVSPSARAGPPSSPGETPATQGDAGTPASDATPVVAAAIVVVLAVLGVTLARARRKR